MSKYKYFLLNWYKNDELNGGRNIVTSTYSKAEMYELHKHDYKSGNTLEIEDLTFEEAKGYDDWMKEEKDLVSDHLYYWNIKTDKLIEKVKIRGRSESRLGKFIESLSNEANLLVLNQFKSINITKLHEVIYKFINDKDNQGKDGKYLSVKSGNDHLTYIKDAVLLLVSARFNKMNYLTIEFMISSTDSKVDISSDVFTVNVKFNESTNSFEIIGKFNTIGSEDVTKLLNSTVTMFNSKHYTIQVSDNQVSKIFK